MKGTVIRKGPHGLAVGLDARMPTGDERNLLGSGAAGVKPFVAYSGSFHRLSPHVNFGYQWNGSSVLAGDVESRGKGRPARPGALRPGRRPGRDADVQHDGGRTGAAAIDSPRIRVRAIRRDGAAGAVTFDDIAIFHESFWASSAAVGFKANLRGSLLVDFNLRFTLGTNGLTDRVTPLLGIEYGF